MLVLAALILLAPAVHATTYKWVDDQGVVHYTDKMPPEAINKGSVELNKQGVPIKKNDPALTPEQRRAREAEEERARQAAKARDEIAAQGPRAAAILYDRKRNRPVEKARVGHDRGADTVGAGLCRHAQQAERRNPWPASPRSATSRSRPSLEREVANVNEELAEAGGPDRREAQGSRRRDRALRRGQAALARTADDRRSRSRQQPARPRNDGHRQSGASPPPRPAANPPAPFPPAARNSRRICAAATPRGGPSAEPPSSHWRAASTRVRPAAGLR